MAKYNTHVKPHLDKIKQMKTGGATERQIANSLNIAYSTFNNYKKQHKELEEALLDANAAIVTQVRGKLIDRATGYYITEEKNSITSNPDGTTTEKKETTQKYIAPDVGAIVLVLKNYDPDFTNDDKQTVDRKNKELEIKEHNSKKDDW